MDCLKYVVLQWEELPNWIRIPGICGKEPTLYSLRMFSRWVWLIIVKMRAMFLRMTRIFDNFDAGPAVTFETWKQGTHPQNSKISTRMPASSCFCSSKSCVSSSFFLVRRSWVLTRAILWISSETRTELFPEIKNSDQIQLKRNERGPQTNEYRKEGFRFESSVALWIRFKGDQSKKLFWFLLMSEDAWRCQRILNNPWQCSTMHDDSWKCLKHLGLLY